MKDKKATFGTKFDMEWYHSVLQYAVNVTYIDRKDSISTLDPPSHR